MQAAISVLIATADGGPTMFASIALMQAIMSKGDPVYGPKQRSLTENHDKFARQQPLHIDFNFASSFLFSSAIIASPVPVPEPAVGIPPAPLD